MARETDKALLGCSLLQLALWLCGIGPCRLFAVHSVLPKPHAVQAAAADSLGQHAAAAGCVLRVLRGKR